LLRPNCPPGTHPGLRRLREGKCAREDCQSHFYRLIFHNGAGIPWAAVLRPIEAIGTQPAPDEAEAPAPAPEPGRFAAALRRYWRVGVLVAVTVTLLLMRQVYLGGQ